MQPIEIICPYCGKSMSYWTRDSFIFCPDCKKRIDVKPCREELDLGKEEKKDKTL